MKYDDWQNDILKQDGHILLCTGRRVGKTTIFAAKAAERMVKHPKTEIVAVSLTEDQAFLMRIMVEDYLKEHYPTWLKVRKKDKPTKSRIKLSNGSKYTVRPVGNTGDAVRGFNANVLIVDEAAFMPEDMWLAAKPTLLTTGGDIWMCSTPHGKQGYFYECFENKHDRWNVYHISSENVIHNRLISESWTQKEREMAVEYLNQEKQDMSELQYAQEYLGEFVDEFRRFFTDKWIERVCTLTKFAEISRNADRFLGVDIARLGQDHTVFEVLQKTDAGSLWHLHHEVQKKWLTTQTEERIIQLTQALELRKAYIDAGAGSLGVGVLDHLLANDKTKRKVEAVNNRQIVRDRDGKKQRLLKEDLYDNMKALGEKGLLFLLDRDDIRLALRSIQYEYITKASQKSRLNIFASPHNAGDVIEALIRACVGSKERIKNFKVYRIPV